MMGAFPFMGPFTLSVYRWRSNNAKKEEEVGRRKEKNRAESSPGLEVVLPALPDSADEQVLPELKISFAIFPH